jgi:hypothetical protein
VPAEAGAEAGKRKSESRIVHFRQLFQEGGTTAFPFDTIGKYGHSAAILPEAGREATFSIFPLFMPQHGGRR